MIIFETVTYQSYTPAKGYTIDRHVCATRETNDYAGSCICQLLDTKKFVLVDVDNRNEICATFDTLEAACLDMIERATSCND